MCARLLLEGQVISDNVFPIFTEAHNISGQVEKTGSLSIPEKVELIEGPTYQLQINDEEMDIVLTDINYITGETSAYVRVVS